MDEAGLTREEASTQFIYEMAGWNNRLQAIAALEGMSSIERYQLDATLAMFYGVDRGVARMFYEWVKPDAPPEAIRYI